MGVAEWVAIITGVLFPAIGFVIVAVIRSAQKTADRVDDLRMKVALLEDRQNQHAASLSSLSTLAGDVREMMGTLVRVEEWIRRQDDHPDNRHRRIGDTP